MSFLLKKSTRFDKLLRTKLPKYHADWKANADGQILSSRPIFFLAKSYASISNSVCGNSFLLEKNYPLLRICDNNIQTQRAFTTAYQGEPSDGKLNSDLLSHLIPYEHTLTDGRRVEIDFFQEDERFAGMALMNLIIREGRSWPFEDDFHSVEQYSGYFLSHTAFVVRSLNNGMDASKRNSSSQGEILGCFYIKPNFPGRCSHVCNGGFITAPRFRGLGVGSLMGKVFLRAARDLGYKSSYFNLVFKSNETSVKLWESLGFERVTTLEKAARLEGLEELDTAYGYRYDLETLPEDYLGIPAAPHRQN